MAAILTAIQSPTITRLSLTFDLLPNDVKSMVKQMSGLLDPRQNYDAYKKVLGNPGSPCIPLLGKRTERSTRRPGLT
jgi:hypothetical protein